MQQSIQFNLVAAPVSSESKPLVTRARDDLFTGCVCAIIDTIVRRDFDGQMPGYAKLAEALLREIDQTFILTRVAPLRTARLLRAILNSSRARLHVVVASDDPATGDGASESASETWIG